MCGLAGWFDLTGSKPPPLDLVVMWSILAARGTDASGAMWNDRTSSKLYVLKGAHKSYDWAVKMWERLGYYTPTWVALHTRAATTGKPDNNNNNHPVNAGPIWLMHNGIISNHEDVFKKLQKARKAEVDTIAIAACLASGGLPKVLELCRGSMSLVWTDKRDAGKLHLYTNGRSPLCVSNVNGVFMFASTEDYLPACLVKEFSEVAAGEHVVLEANKPLIKTNVGTGKTIEVQQWVNKYVSWAAGLYKCYALDCNQEVSHTHTSPTYTTSIHKQHSEREASGQETYDSAIDG